MHNLSSFAIIVESWFFTFENMFSVFEDKTYLGLVCVSLITTAASFYFLRQFIVTDAGIWTALMFIPIYFYAILIFVLNTSLSIISYKRDRFLSLAFLFATITINVLLLAALLLNIKNPNG